VTPPDTFAARLRARREANGWTVYKLAQVAELDRSFVARLESGEQSPSLEVATRLAHALGLGLDAWDPGPRGPGQGEEKP
jgi:transcriptional regulator with XRE-family HTH domain